VTLAIFLAVGSWRPEGRSFAWFGAHGRPAVLAAFGRGQTPVVSQAPVWLQRLQRWLLAMRQHEPGTADAEARQFATLTRGQMQALLADLLALRDGLMRAYERPLEPGEIRAITYAESQFEVSEVQRWLGLGDDEARRGDINRILWSGALLHSDIAMLVPSDDRPIVGRSRLVRLRDGQLDGYEYSVAPVWEFARNLLDATRPDPSHDGVVLLWYKATAAYLLQGSLSDATAQLDRGRRLFASDADLLFFSGCVHEYFAARDLQGVARSIALPPGTTLAIGSTRSHLREAETFFRKALESNSRLTEARVRLGHVLGLLNRHEEAATELRQAATGLGDPLLLYYAQMLLGDEEQALGRRDAARDWYERAARANPGAQSPLFALSHLALAAGDHDGAVRAMNRLHSLPDDEAGGSDPWPNYYVTAGRRADALLAELRAAAPTLEKR